MTPSEYLKLTDQTAIYPGTGSGSHLELFYLALGLTSEAGEVAGKVKKLIRDKELSESALAAEVGDCFWYCVRLCQALGYTPEEVMENNINKLLKRKDAGTIKGNGDER